MRQRGFTLLELMISILMFAMISTAAYKLFDSVSRAQSVTDGILDKLDAIQRAEIILEKDFMQLASRSIKNESGDRVAAVQAPSADGYLVEFTRSGWRNPLDVLRSNLQRVAYSVEDNELVRYYWVMLDRSPEPVQQRQTVLSGVRSMKIRFLDEKKQWRGSWPPAQTGKSKLPGQGKDKGSAMPFAVEIALMHEEFGSIMTVVPSITHKSSQSKEGEKGKDDPNLRDRKPQPEPSLDDPDGDGE